MSAGSPRRAELERVGRLLVDGSGRAEVAAVSASGASTFVDVAIGVGADRGAAR